MKKIINYFSILFLISFSFFYTEKVITLINKNDPLMEEIVKFSSNYEILPINATINDDAIIPGISGREVDAEKSYNNMKTGGIFREDSIVYKYLYPKNSLYENKDKYIVKGNSLKKEVAVLIVFNSKYCDVIESLNSATIFINHNDLNVNNILSLNNKEIYTYGNSGLYTSELLVNDNTLINRLSNNISKYCLLKQKNQDILKICNAKDMFMIIPNIIGGYYEVKNNLSNGSIILVENMNEINLILKYIKSKGFEVVGLDKLINE